MLANKFHLKNSYLKYITALLLFGSNGVISKYINLPSNQLVLIRSAIGALTLIIIYYASGNKIKKTHQYKDIFYIVLSGIAMALDWLLLFAAYNKIGICLSDLINYTGPIIVIALSPLILKERISAVAFLSLFITIIGVLLLSQSAVTGDINIQGIIYAILSAVAYAAMILSDKKAKNIIGLDNSLLQLSFAAISIAIIVLVKDGIHISFTFQSIIPILWLGIFNTGIGCMLYFSTIGDLPTQSVAILGYLEPMFSVLLAFLILHETMTYMQIIGAILIIAGSLLSELKKKHPDL